MTTAAQNEAEVGAEAAAGSNFGNKEAITATAFGIPSPSVNPAQPDFVTEGMVLNLAAAASGTPVTSKSVRVTDRPGATAKTLHVWSDHTGAFDVQVMLTESDATWYTYLSAQPVVANTLKTISTNDLFRQIRIIYTPSSGPAVVKSWVFSIP